MFNFGILQIIWFGFTKIMIFVVNLIILQFGFLVEDLNLT